MADQPFQALYRRHRPRRFAEVRGQDHVTTALRNAVAAERVAHAYLFSGPRGTGKTSTARILAAALNCANPVGGEPDGICDSCVAVQTGASLDVLELDAASNNGVDAIRDLVGRAALGSPGRWKVYIVDEVHMLTTGASNALLKTLEEPPAHVVFVLATTDDQKVLPTIKSRTQHYHFRLLAPEILSSLVADLNESDDLGLDPATLDRVVRKGNGSARDALSALDQAAAAGVAEDESEAVPQIVEALVNHDAGAALVAVAEAARRGRDPHRLAIEVVEHLRSGFLLVMAPDVAGVPEQQRAALEDHARRLGTPATVRAMEVLGETLVAIRESLDARVTLELALVRLASPAADTSPAAMLERLEGIERRVASGGSAPAQRGDGPPGGSPASRPAASPRGDEQPARPEAWPRGDEPRARPEATPRGDEPRARPEATPGGDEPRARPEATPRGGEPPARPALPSRPDEHGTSSRPSRPDERGTPPPARARPAAPPPPPAVGPRPTIGAVRQRAAQAPAREEPHGGGEVLPPEPQQEAPSRQHAPPLVMTLDRDELTKVWGDQIFGNLSSRARAAFRNGMWLKVDGSTAVFLLGDGTPLAAAQDRIGEVEGSLAAHLGAALRVRLELGRAADDESHISPDEFARLEPAPDPPASAEARVLEAFPGTEEISG